MLENVASWSELNRKSNLLTWEVERLRGNLYKFRLNWVGSKPGRLDGCANYLNSKETDGSEGYEDIGRMGSLAKHIRPRCVNGVAVVDGNWTRRTSFRGRRYL